MKIKLLSSIASAAALLAFTACSATPPSKLETSIMTRAKHAVFIRNGKARNPLPATADNVAMGKQAFSYYCVACHGLDGQNTGVPFADRMSPPVPSLSSPTIQSYSDGQLKWIIENGISPSGMPASKGTLNDDEMWSIVLYIRHLPPAGSLGEPSMYSGAGESSSPQGQ